MSYPIALLFLFTLIFIASVFIVTYRTFQAQRLKRRIASMPFPETWRRTLERTSHYPQLDAARKWQSERAVLQFVHTKSFAGVGMAVTEEMKVITAFYACLMVQNRPGYGYDRLKTILFYSDDFVVDNVYEHGGIVSEERDILDGQSSNDTVVLSWPQAESEAYHPGEHNVIIHEFAHVLDFEDGFSDGRPPLSRSESEEWSLVLHREYEKLVHALDRGHHSGKYELLGAYAATNEAELFAVASERYFCSPTRLRNSLPELYTLLDAFYAPANLGGSR